MRWAATLVLSACATFQRVPLKSVTVRLDDGRFAGPFEVKVPRRAEHANHDFEIRVTLVARCAPALTLAFPDGETELLGENDPAWQSMLEQRAQQEPAATAAPTRAPRQTSRTGHWERAVVERWHGQLEFERMRHLRCAELHEYRAKHLNAYDESGALTLWATVPQELAGAELHYEIVERVPTQVEAPPPPPEERPAPHGEAPQHEAAKPRPEKPSPKRESPGDPEVPGARWQAGEWVWVEGQGEWVWYSGYWLAPPTAPALQTENPGVPPVAGCRWVSGHWEWNRGPGHWVWRAGYWTEPPPLDEPRGPSPGEGAQWKSGRWSWQNHTYVWLHGRWGKPSARAETIPPAPFAGAHWIPGDWLDLNGEWKWSPGFYEGTQRPPPPRAETPPPKPAPDAQWLQGFWRWDPSKQDHLWVPGHWELPPGEGYVWVADQPGVQGHWELRVRIVP
jgi:hypothetical protein